MSLINKLYDKVYCISLLERKDKYNHSIKQFDKWGINVEFYRPVIPGYASKLINPYADKYNDYNINHILFNKSFPNEFGAMSSHYHVIKTALLEGAKSIFIFEDDCLFHKDFNYLLPKYFNTLPDNVDSVMFYSYMSKLEPQNIRVSSKWTKGYASWSLLAYGMTERAMKGYIDIQDSHPMIADKTTWIMMTQLNYNFYIASPPLIIPSNTLKSSIRGNDKNYEKPHFLGGNVFMLGINTNDYE